MANIQIWKLNHQGSESIQANVENSLDTFTRRWPGGLYTTFRTYGNGKRVIDLRAHLLRLYGPSAKLGIQPSVQPSTLRMRIAVLLPSEPESRVRVILSREGDIFVIIEPLIPLDKEIYQRGVMAITLEGHHEQPGLKKTGFIAESQAEREVVRAAGAFEGLLTMKGRILEGLTSNFFYVRDQAVGTAKFGVLPGVTRGMVLRILKGSGIKVSFRSLHQTELPGIDEAFISSSSRGVVPVVEIDGLRFGKGEVGPVTRQLIGSFGVEIERLAEPIN